MLVLGGLIQCLLRSGRICRRGRADAPVLVVEDALQVVGRQSGIERYSLAHAHIVIARELPQREAPGRTIDCRGRAYAPILVVGQLVDGVGSDAWVARDCRPHLGVLVPGQLSKPRTARRRGSLGEGSGEWIGGTHDAMVRPVTPATRMTTPRIWKRPSFSLKRKYAATAAIGANCEARTDVMAT